MNAIHIEQRTEYEYQVHNLKRNENVWIQIENFDIKLKRTDEGLVVDVFDMDDELREEPISTLHAFDEETKLFQGEP